MDFHFRVADSSGRGKSDALPKYFSFAERRYRRSGNSDFQSRSADFEIVMATADPAVQRFRIRLCCAQSRALRRPKHDQFSRKAP